MGGGGRGVNSKSSSIFYYTKNVDKLWLEMTILG